MNKYNNLLLIAVACIAGFLGGQASALVSAHEGDTAMIHGCVNLNSGEIKIVDANAACPSAHWKLLDWNIQGPPGPPGPGGNFPPFTCGEGEIPGDLLGDRYVGKDFTNAVFTSCTFASVNFTDTNFHGAFMAGQFTGSNFTNANLTDTDMTADFANSNFTNADLTNARVTLSNLTGADMTGAIVTGIIWSATFCPDGTNSDDNGGTCDGHLVP